MATQLSVILDDILPAFTYGGGDWTTARSSAGYGGSWTLCPVVSPTGQMKPPGTIVLTFEGTSIAFFGITPSVFADSQVLIVAIDGGTPYNTTYADNNPQSYRQWYQSPLLADGQHNISLTHIEGTSLDFAVATVPKNGSLAGQQVIVDDTDASIVYKGSWNRNSTWFAAGTVPGGYPYGNSTHRTTTPGDTFTFQFSGTAVSVYGVWNWGNLDGNLSATYTLDGTPYNQTYTITPPAPNGDLPNFLFFNAGGLSGGDHTLLVNLTICVKQAFMIDYITYTPSSSSSSSSSSTTSSTSSSHPVATASKSAPIGAIAGGVVGGVALLLVILGFFWFRNRGSKKAAIPQDTSRDSTTGMRPVPPFDAPSPASLPIATSSRIGSGNVISPFVDAAAAQTESQREAALNRKFRPRTPQDLSVHKPGYIRPTFGNSEGVAGESSQQTPTDSTSPASGGATRDVVAVPPPAYDG